MVSLRDWWTERWRSLAGWQRTLALTVLGGLALNRGLPLVERVVASLSTFTQASILGLVIVGALRYGTVQIGSSIGTGSGGARVAPFMARPREGRTPSDRTK